MPIDQRELRDLLDERSSPALDRPIPWHSLRARARGARRRRLATVAAAVSFAVAVVAGGTVVSLRGPDQPTTANMTEKLPSRYEESDGTVYRRLATATFDPARQASVLFEVEVSGKPVAILPDCPSPKAAPPQVIASVPGLDKTFTLSPAPFLMNACERGKAVDMQPFPAGTRTVIFTVKGSPERTAPGKWRFGVYEWTPPATMKPASPPARAAREGPEGARPGRQGHHHLARQPRGDGHRAEQGPRPGRRHLLRRRSRRPAQPEGVGERTPDQGQRRLLLLAGRGGGFLYLGKRLLSGKTTTIRVRLETSIPEYLRRPGTLTVAVYAGDM
ncbi:hypothetical protein [Nonomuraea salmonea]|uniref:hypothetical protein n=1 Tax=Nonomuraea salmonea TaxID=46181 RepID=UPI002FEA6511